MSTIFLVLLCVIFVEEALLKVSSKPKVQSVREQKWLANRDLARRREFEHADRVHVERHSDWALWISPAVPAAIVGGMLVCIWFYLSIWRQRAPRHVH